MGCIPLLRRQLRPAAWIVVLAALLLPAAANDGSDALSALKTRRADLRSRLVLEKARILQQDPEAVALRERIQRLYRQLDQLVTDKPAIRQLQQELQTLNQAIEKSAAQ